MEVTTQPTQERAIFLRNQATTTKQCTIQQKIPLGDIEEKVAGRDAAAGLPAFLHKQAHKKAGRKTLRFLAQPFYFGDLLDSPVSFNSS